MTAWERIKALGRRLMRRWKRHARTRQRTQDHAKRSARPENAAPALDTTPQQPIAPREDDWLWRHRHDPLPVRERALAAPPQDPPKAVGRSLPPAPREAPTPEPRKAPPPWDEPADRPAPPKQAEPTPTPADAAARRAAPQPSPLSREARLRRIREARVQRRAKRHAGREPSDRFAASGDRPAIRRPETEAPPATEAPAANPQPPQPAPTPAGRPPTPVPIDVLRPSGRGDAETSALANAIIEKLRPELEKQTNNIVNRLSAVIEQSGGYAP